MIDIKNRFTETVVCSGKSKKIAAEKNKADLSRADLSGADLSGADLSGADLSGADLFGADLSGADLSEADLSRADLSGADLSRADLSGADLSGADLFEANLFRADLSGADLFEANLSRVDLSRADLSGADLSGANLSRVDLSGATLVFSKFPSTKVLASINLGELSSALTTELMRRDAYAHPEPELFDAWAVNGVCPYSGNIDEFWVFNIKRNLWKPGPPEMADRDLIIAICKEKKWGIKGYLEIEK